MDLFRLIKFISRTIEWGGRKVWRTTMDAREKGGGRWDIAEGGRWGIRDGKTKGKVCRT